MDTRDDQIMPTDCHHLGHGQQKAYSNCKAKWLRHCIAIMMLLISFAVQAEESANTQSANSTGEAVILNKIIRSQQQPQQSNESSPEVQPLQVENDLTEGTSRQLPTMNQPVIDQAGILDATQQQQLADKIRHIHTQGLAQIGVVIVPTTGQEDIFSYAMRVADAWQLGTAKQDNGLLMVIAINDRRIQILTGYGLEGVLPDIMVSRIISQHMRTYFRHNQFAQGIDAGLNEITRLLQEDPEITRQAAEALKERQTQALQAENARQSSLKMAFIILLFGMVATLIIGRRLAASTAGVAAFVAGLVSGLGIFGSILLAVGVFFLLITSLAQLIVQGVLSGSRGGGSGGGGFGGGGGGFGGGGASGSW